MAVCPECGNDLSLFMHDKDCSVLEAEMSEALGWEREEKPSHPRVCSICGKELQTIGGYHSLMCPLHGTRGAS